MAKFRGIFRGKPRYVTVRPEAEAQAQAQVEKKEVPDGLWTKCVQCRAMLYNKDLERHAYVCDKCGYHFRIGAVERLHILLDDPEAFEEFDAELAATDPLGFPLYPEKLARDMAKTGQRDAVITGIGSIGGVRAVLAVMDFQFLGGSMGSVVGEKVARAFERAAAESLPIVTFSASGGARMQEGILSLMQMEKTAAAVELYSRRGLLFISVLTDPSTAGVFGSFASLGDIILAEPGATVGFAGQRVIEETIRKAVPPSLQKAETVFANGFIDRIVPRTEMKETLGKLLLWHTVQRVTTPPAGREAAPERGEAAQGEESPAQEDSGGAQERLGQVSRAQQGGGEGRPSQEAGTIAGAPRELAAAKSHGSQGNGFVNGVAPRRSEGAGGPGSRSR